MKKKFIVFLPVICIVLGGCKPEETKNPVKAAFDYSFSGANTRAPASVDFFNTSTGAATYQWDFGDGNTSVENEPVHIFEAAGTYTVSLTATDGSATDMATKTITIEPAYTGLRLLTLTATNCPATNMGNPWDTPGGPDPQGLPDLYIVLKDQSMNILIQTSVVNNQFPPVGENINFTLPDLSQNYILELYDEDGASDQLLGTSGFRPADLIHQPQPYPGTLEIVGSLIPFSANLQWIP